MSRRHRLSAFAVVLGVLAAGLVWHQPVRWVSTLAGSEKGMVDGLAADARFQQPNDLALDETHPARPILYVADTYNHRIRAIDLEAPGGAFVSTLAGSGIASHAGGGAIDGPAAGTSFRFPRALAFDGSRPGHPRLYVADTNNDRIRMIDIAAPGRPVTTIAGGRQGFADGPGLTARFRSPWGLALAGPDTLWVADTYNHALRRIDLKDPAHPVTAWGDGGGHRDGPLAKARFFGLSGLEYDPALGMLYVADASNRSIRRIATRSAGMPVSTWAGSRASVVSRDEWLVDIPLIYPATIALAPGGYLLTADQATNTIVRISPDGALLTLAGQAGQDGGLLAGPGFVARFREPAGLAVARDGTVYVADVGNHRIRTFRPVY